MLSFNTLLLLALSFGSSLVLAFPQCSGLSCHGIPEPTCTANYLTTIYTTSKAVTTYKTVPVTTYDVATITSVATIPYSCYTYLEPTPVSNNDYCGTFDPSTCTGPVPLVIEVDTLTVPCHDPCCPTTTTIQTAGRCAQCPGYGGAFSTTTVLVTPTNCPAQTTY